MRAMTFLAGLLLVSAPAFAAKFRFEEAWSPSCAATARAASAPGPDVTNPVPRGGEHSVVGEPSKWGVRCDELFPMFEIVVSAKGDVQCVRILNLTRDRRAPEGYRDEVRERIRRMKFRPATKNGKPVAVRYFYTVHLRCA